ncbi:MAG: 4-hydroxy-tetrahydrodipicolinate synthase [Bacteroidales bacterium]|jgi:4-hydroxy-tetrahydrodipicolinate synthase|nr:4-hydroxy-tetrahydrodipicolinate synthase [Bacteroidales bacterium]
MLADKFIGTGVALITPFKTNGSVDFEALKRVVNHVVAGGVDYVVALGTTSETPTLRVFERDVVVRIIVEEVDGRVPIVVGVGMNSTSECVEILRTSDFSGVSGILSVVPYYNKPTQEGLFQHFSEIAKNSPLPIILYNIPSRCGVNMTADTTLQLANAYSNIVGIKEASADMTQIKDIIRLKSSGFQVISGDDALALEIIEAGGSGVISVLGNALPTQVSTMIRTALAGKFDLAQKELDEFEHLIPLLFAEGNPAGIKTMMNNFGFCENELRLPLVKCSDSLQNLIRTELESFSKR